MADHQNLYSENEWHQYPWKHVVVLCSCSKWKGGGKKQETIAIIVHIREQAYPCSVHDFTLGQNNSATAMGEEVITRKPGGSYPHCQVNGNVLTYWLGYLFELNEALPDFSHPLFFLLSSSALSFSHVVALSPHLHPQCSPSITLPPPSPPPWPPPTVSKLE